MPRSFIAIEISESVRNSLKKVQNELQETGADLKLVSPANIHLTLRFLGDVPESKLDFIKKAMNEAASVEPFQMQVKGLGVFPKPGYIRVIWAGVSKGSGEIEYLWKKLNRKLSEIDLPSDDNEFTPHLTISRVNSGKAKEKLNMIVENKSEVEWGTVEVNEMELKKSELTSEGPIYTTLEKAELG